MTETAAMPPRGWRFGMHPKAVGMQIRSFGRVDLPLGEALRLEMFTPDGQGKEDDAHVQYYICTASGGWALWLSGPQAEVVAREAALMDLVPPSESKGP